VLRGLIHSFAVCRDIIKDVTVTLVPLALDKIEAAEGNKKVSDDAQLSCFRVDRI
jgi:hypothetical protein